MRLTGVVLLIALGAARVGAEEGDAVPAAKATAIGGVLTALAPAVVSSALLSTSDSAQTKTAAIHLVEWGLAVAPMVAHGTPREWKRGLAFSAVPVASAIAMSLLIGIRPITFTEGTKKDIQYAFAGLLSVSILSSGVGLIDGIMGIERAKRLVKTSNAHALWIGPVIGSERAMISVGGNL